MSLRHVIAIIAMVLLIVTLSYAITMRALGPVPLFKVRRVSEFYLTNAFNPFNKTISAMTPEVVTSIIWDYRGLDTLFETAVFYLAIIATAMLYRGVIVRRKTQVGLSPIVKTATKIVVPSIIVIAIAVALHGHLTPGGGFQGGSIAAVTFALILVTFSLYTLNKIGACKEKLLALRSLGLLSLIATSIIVFVMGMLLGIRAFILQNQAKLVSIIGLPYKMYNFLISGSCFFFNVSEALAVSMAFGLLFIFISIFEEDVEEALKRREEVE